MRKKTNFLFVFILAIITFIPSIFATDKVDDIVLTESSYNNESIYKYGASVSLEKDTDGSVALAGNDVIIEKNIIGASIAAGNQIDFSGASEYLFLVGNSIKTNGNVARDAFIFGSIIEADGVFGRDVTIFGSSVKLKGNYTRNLVIKGNKVIIDGAKINGNIHITADKIEVINRAVIEGRLKYNEDAEINIANSTITIQETFANKNAFNMKEHLTSVTFSFINKIVLFAVLTLIFPCLFNKINRVTAKDSVNEVFTTAIKGLIGLIIIPITAILLLVSSIGISVGLILLVLYFIIIYASSIFAGYFIGKKLWGKLIKSEEQTLLVGIFGIFLLTVLNLIPYFNILVSFASLIIGIGIVLNLFKRETIIQTNEVVKEKSKKPIIKKTTKKND